MSVNESALDRFILMDCWLCCCRERALIVTVAAAFIYWVVTLVLSEVSLNDFAVF